MSATWTLAVTGKGGVGKTTLAALAVRWLGEHDLGPVLAVDADPNTCLDALLGVRADAAVGTIREEVKQIAQSLSPSTGGMAKQQLLELKIQQSLIETDKFDLIAMGRPEGPGCYCYANNVLGAAIRQLASNYASVVIDNEAGLENLSRRIVKRVDHLLFVADPSQRGLMTARRLYDLAVEMRIDAASMSLVWNRARGGAGAECARVLFDDTPVALLGAVPEDAELAAQDEMGVPIGVLRAENPALTAAASVFAKLCKLRSC